MEKLPCKTVDATINLSLENYSDKVTELFKAAEVNRNEILSSTKWKFEGSFDD